MAIDMDGRIYSLLGGWKGIFQRLRVDKRERGNTRDRAESIIRKVNEANEMVREDRERERNSRAESIRGINDEMTNMGKEREIERGVNSVIKYCGGGEN